MPPVRATTIAGYSIIGGRYIKKHEQAVGPAHAFFHIALISSSNTLIASMIVWKEGISPNSICVMDM